MAFFFFYLQSFLISFIKVITGGFWSLVSLHNSGMIIFLSVSTAKKKYEKIRTGKKEIGGGLNKLHLKIQGSQ